MRKRWLSLLLALVMLASVTVTTASADTVNLLNKTVTLSVTPSQSAICVGSTGDVYVTYTISIEADVPIPAFQFRLPADAKLATQVQSNDSNWYYWFNTDALKQKEGKGGGGGPYNEAGYAPDTGFVGVGGSDDGKGLTSVTVMTTVAKFEKKSVPTVTTHTLKPTEFIAGGGETIDSNGGVEISNAFGTRNVEVDSVTVKPGTTVSGTVKDSSDKAVSGATVELYKDGYKVGEPVITDSSGKYTIPDVSTGTYTVKAETTVDGKELNGSADVTVKADSILNADVTVAKGFTVSGTIKSYGSASEAVTVTLTPSSGTPLTTTVTGNSANYSFPTVPAGTYTLKVEKKGHAPWTESITVDSAAIAKDVTVYLYGDINGDGFVKANDKTILARHLSYWPGYETLPVYPAVADLNGDGYIKANDKTILARYLSYWPGYETLPIT